MTDLQTFATVGLLGDNYAITVATPHRQLLLTREQAEGLRDRLCLLLGMPADDFEGVG